ncbi:MAG: hypothetical protein HUU50_02300 [Candidatus Brocadiae bacterium]|nr:hypothetical protein [Candidatus Brocadiia bacterium]
MELVQEVIQKLNQILFPKQGILKSLALFVLAGMDTLDATDLKMTFLGHFYYVRHHAMTQEIQELLCFNRDPNTRKGELFKEFLDNGMVYWKILNTRTSSSGGDAYREKAKIYYATDRALR